MDSLAAIKDFQSLPLTGRRWQLEAMRKLNKLIRKGQRDFLLVAAPAAGKTSTGLEAARILLNESEVERIVVVCHSNHLRQQWARAASKVNISLDAAWSNSDGVESSDYQGVVVTYQQVVFAPDLFRMNCARKTLVILDEIHHAGERKAYGEALQQAFDAAAFRIGLSGTLFRGDNRKIPFVKYENGCSKPDFAYGYREAVADCVCRPIYFLTYEGEAVWMREGDDQLYEHSMLDVVDRETAAARLRAILDPSKEWVQRVVKNANEHLTQIRDSGHGNAGGLIVAQDQEHARRLASLVREVSGEATVVAISADPDASARITEFAEGSQRWIITVRMVSEGVDIPRLRVGVYATNVQTELFFRQVCGRLTRYTQGLREQSAVLYLPADEALIRYALAIKEEREHQVGSEADDEADDLPAAEEFILSGKEWGEHMIKVLSTELRDYDAVFDGDSYTQPELTSAAQVARLKGITAPFVHIAAIWRMAAAQAGVFIRQSEDLGGVVPCTQSLSPPHAKPSVGSIKMLREQTERMAQTLAIHLGVPSEEVHREWINLGGMSQEEVATLGDLESKLEWLRHRLRDETEAKGHLIGDSYCSLDEIKDRLGR
jgi:superfamily II DNA or RNA helicase